MILGFVIDEHGNTITGRQVDQIMADVQKWAENMAPVLEQLAQAYEQIAAAFAAWGDAVLQAAREFLGTATTNGWLLLGEPDLEYLELAYKRYARWYNARHRGRQVSWRRLNVDQRWDAERRFAL